MSSSPGPAVTTPSDLDDNPEGEAGATGPAPVADTTGAGAGRRLHPLTPLFASLGLGRALLPQGVIAYGFGGLRLLGALLVLQLVGQTIGWHRRAYDFDGEVLRIDSGVFSRNQELVPARRIQQVNLVEKLLHRLVGVATLKVETAGGGAGSAISLEVVAVEEAHRLRDALLAAKARAGAGPRHDGVSGDDAEGAPAWVPAPWTVVRLGYRQLAVAGLTGGELLVIFAALASVFTFVDGLPDQVAQRLAGVDVEVGTGLIVVGVVVFVVLWLGSAAGAAILRNANYHLVLLGDELHVERGLLERKQGAVPLARIQAVRIDASPVRRLLGLVTVRFQSAGRGSGTEESRIDVPVLDEDEVERVLALALPGATPLPVLHRPPRAALQRAVVRRVVPTAVLGTLLGIVAGIPGVVVAVAAVCLSVWWGFAAYRALGHAVGGGFLYTRSGAFLRRTIVVPMARAQSAQVRCSPFQRRVGLGTLEVDLAGPGANPRVVDEAAPVATSVLGQVMADVGGAVRSAGAAGSSAAVSPPDEGPR